MNNRYIIMLIALFIIIGGLVYVFNKPKEVLAPAPQPVPVATSTIQTAVPATTTAATTTKPVVTPKPTPVTAKPTPTPTPTPTTPTVKTYTLAEISTHADKTNCWTAVDGNVYDVTAYVPKHPGGVREITQICGKDGSSLFKNQHGGDKKPNNVLASYMIGVLAK